MSRYDLYIDTDGRKELVARKGTAGYNYGSTHNIGFDTCSKTVGCYGAGRY